MLRILLEIPSFLFRTYYYQHITCTVPCTVTWSAHSSSSVFPLFSRHPSLPESPPDRFHTLPGVKPIIFSYHIRHNIRSIIQFFIIDATLSGSKMASLSLFTRRIAFLPHKHPHAFHTALVMPVPFFMGITENFEQV